MKIVHAARTNEPSTRSDEHGAKSEKHGARSDEHELIFVSSEFRPQNAAYSSLDVSKHQIVKTIDVLT